MTLRRVLEVVDYHTEGEPMRIVRSGLPEVAGATMLERSARVAAEHDELRRLVLFEPRGHAAMCAAFLVAPTDPAADAGVIFVEPAGVVHMCGHGAIAIASMLVETGVVAAREPETPVVLDTAAGRVTARVQVRDGQVKATTIRNVPAYSVLLDALVEAAGLGLELVPEAASRLVATGERIRAAVEAEVDLTHPEGEQAKGLVYVQFYGPPRDPRAHLRNAVVVAPAGLDRSPCGTGTSARLANLWARGTLTLGQEFVHESIIGTRFEARVVATTRVGPRDAVVPEVTGRAYPAARSQLLLRADDPFPGGFLL
jgi:proline racemase